VLDAALVAQLRDHFTKLTRPVRLVAALDDSPASAQVRELLTDIASTSADLTFDAAGSDERRPSFTVTADGVEDRVRFAGLPLGHEFTSLVLAVLQVGGHPANVDATLVERIKALPGDLSFTTYFSQTCQNCPEVVQALDLISVLNPGVSHVAVDGGVFRDEVEARQVLAVPTVYLGDDVWGQGRMTLADIVDKLAATDPGEAAAALSAREPYDVLIVGGGPAGAAAAVYAARKGIRTGLVTERVGGQVLDTAGIENVVSIRSTDGTRLAADLEAHVADYDVDVIPRQRAAHLTPAAEPGGLARVTLESGGALEARTVIVTTGARWRQLGVPGEAELRNKGVTYCPHCDGPLFKGKQVAVVGGGNSGVEAAIDLAGVAGHVTLLEFQPALRADDVLQRKLRSLPNVDIVLNAATTGVLGTSSVTGLAYTDRGSEETRQLDVEGVFVQIGLLPNTEWLEGTIDRTPWGEIKVDAHGATSAPGVWAAGDCTTEPYKQIVVALGAGATAALAAFDHLIRVTAPAEDEVAVPA
jgi:alkyl hydroperoxide reductase subunit F